MRAEHRTNEESIPPVGMQVKRVIVEVLAGQAVRVHDVGMSVSSEASESEVFDVIASVRGVAAATVFLSGFCQGDAYSQARRRSGHERAFAAAFKKRFGAKVFNEVRRCGWVAEKWPPSKRRADRSWNWHIKTPVGGKSALKPPKPAVALEEVRTEFVDGVEWIYQVDDYGKPFVLKRTKTAE